MLPFEALPGMSVSSSGPPALPWALPVGAAGQLPNELSPVCSTILRHAGIPAARLSGTRAFMAILKHSVEVRESRVSAGG